MPEARSKSSVSAIKGNKTVNVKDTYKASVTDPEKAERELQEWLKKNKANLPHMTKGGMGELYGRTSRKTRLSAKLR